MYIVYISLPINTAGAASLCYSDELRLLKCVSISYNVILNTVPEAGSWGSYSVYTGLRGAALEELPASGTVLRIIFY